MTSLSVLEIVECVLAWDLPDEFIGLAVAAQLELSADCESGSHAALKGD